MSKTVKTTETTETTVTRLTLTRYLYITDEVKYSLLLSLIDKKDIHNVLFWAYELYYSGYDEELFKYIRCIYFDFYALQHPKFYRFIDKQYFIKLIEILISCFLIFDSIVTEQFENFFVTVRI